MKINKVLAKQDEKVFRALFPQIPAKAKSFKAFWREDKEASASFYQSPDHQYWYIKDFASGESYDLFSALEKLSNLDFKSSIELIGSHFPHLVIERDDKTPSEWAIKRGIKLTDKEVCFVYKDYPSNQEVGKKYRLFSKNKAPFRCEGDLDLSKYFFYNTLKPSKKLYICGGEGDCLALSQALPNELIIGLSGEPKDPPSQLIQLIRDYKIEEIIIIYDNWNIELDAKIKALSISKKLIECQSVNLIQSLNWEHSVYKDIGFICGLQNKDFLEECVSNLIVLDFKPENEELELFKEILEKSLKAKNVKLDVREIFPECWANYFTQIAKYVDNNFPVEAVITYFLPILSGLMGASFEIRHFKNKHSFLWSIVSMPVGSGKSEALKFLLSNLLTEEKRFDTEFRKEYFEYANKKKKDEKEEFPPYPKHILLEDCTIEAVRKCHSNNQNGLILAHDEMSKLFYSFGQYKKGGVGDDRGTMLVFGSGGSLNLTRSDETKNLRMEKTAISLTGGIQPDVLRSIYKSDFQKHDGLWDRFLIYENTDYMISLENNYNKIPSQMPLIKLYQWVLSKQSKRYQFCFSDKAMQFSQTVSSKLKQKINAANGALKGFLAKQWNQYLQLCLCLHVLETYEENFEMNNSSKISESTAVKAFKLLSLYLSNACNIFGIDAKVKESIDKFEAVLSLDKKVLVIRDIIAKRLVSSKDEAIALFNELEQAGYGETLKTKRGSFEFKFFDRN
jgi:hypothetical protein